MHKVVRLLALTVGLSIPLAVGAVLSSASADPSSGGAERRAAAMKGLQADATRCERGYVIVATGTCTHGPDEAPAGTSFDHRSTAELQETTAGSTGTSSGAPPCIDGGESGPRVEAIYVRSSDVADRYASVAPLISQWAAATDATFAESAAKTGGVRNVRWLMPGCQLRVSQVVMAPTSDDSFGATIAEVRSAGFNRSDRKYVIWADASVYCGIGEFKSDDRAGSNNASNVGPNYARVDAPCWGRSESTEAHELMHMLGGVQYSAPHSNGAGHCSEDYDRMCYRESSTATITYVCPGDHERLFDCGNDDYFHTNPPAGSYLASHWNTASSVFLSTGGPTGSTEPAPTDSQVTSTWSGSLGRKTPTISHAVSMGSGPVEAVLDGGKRSKLTLELVADDGTLVARTSGTGQLTLSTTVTGGGYRWVVSGSGSYTLTARSSAA